MRSVLRCHLEAIKGGGRRTGASGGGCEGVVLFVPVHSQSLQDWYIFTALIKPKDTVPVHGTLQRCIYDSMRR